MALARIITRSQGCARELATELLARGYAVEIVTPDSVPDNRADLELRVEENSGNQLVASVHAHDGPRSASFEFRHQLRAPMSDFLRTMQETTEVVYLSGEPVSFVAEPNTEGAELPAEAQPREPETVSAPAPVLLESCSDTASTDTASTDSGLIDSSPTDSRPSESYPQQAAPPLPELPPLRPVETVVVGASRLTKEAEAPEAPSTLAQPLPAPINLRPAMVQPNEPRTRKRPARWQWRAGLAFASMVSLALVFGLGGRHSERISAPVPAASSAGKAAVPVPSIDAYSPAATSEDDPQKDLTAVPGLISNLPASQPAAEWGWDRGHTPKDATIGNAEDAVVKASIVNKTMANRTTAGKTMVNKTIVDKTGRSRKHDDSSIAPDTVTYFDGRHQPHAPKAQPAKRSARLEPAPRKHSGGVVAANTVTYLNKPIPKPAK